MAVNEKITMKTEVKIREIDAKTGEILNKQHIKYPDSEVEAHGNWKIQEKDAETEGLLKEEEKENVITNGGLNTFAWALAGASSTAYLVLGTGTTTPAAADTSLTTLVSAANKVASKSASGAVVTYSCRYDPEDANGYTYKEAGIYERVTSVQSGVPQGTLINHILISDLEKTAAKIVDFEISITFT